MEAPHSAVNAHVAVLPYPGRGHINPMLRLARRLAARGFLVTVVLTEEWLSLLSDSLPQPLPAAVRLRTIPDVVPSERGRGADFASFIRSVLVRMGSPVAALLAELDPSPDAIIADSMLPWAPVIAHRMGVPVAAFFPQAANVFLAFQELKTLAACRSQPSELYQTGTDTTRNGDGFLDRLPKAASGHLGDFITHSAGEGMLKAFMDGIAWFSSARCLLFNSFDRLERRAFDKLLRANLSVPFYPVGPFVPDAADDEEAATAPCCKWLDSQPKSSVLYVSMSSFLPVSGEEIKEIAVGLQMSGHHFLWAVRDATNTVRELIGEKGMVVPWCDQPRMLRHPSVGGFLTHCGWNSTLEAIDAGVPMLTFPLMWDQYPNSKLVVEDWKIGLRLGDEEKDGVGREEVARAVQRLMDLDAAESKELRRRAMELKERSHAALREKGSSTMNLDAFVDHLLGKAD
ncbi:UDP-glycosyltransferase 87A2-like [Musa acuminata AAA Group]|uniref:UDP-glycosyltransferase 87A2-like n=1 Tax=Musa acuminata AAA Group TaxID=214697 RepID=UPI0031D7E449